MEEPKIYYSESSLNREHMFRKEDLHLIRTYKPEQEILVIYWNERFLLSKRDNGFDIPQLTEKHVQSLQIEQKIFLGFRNQQPAYVADLSFLEHDEISGLGIIEDLRKAFSLITDEDASLLAYAKGMINWHKSHQFCGHCGSKNQFSSKGHVLICSNINCGKTSYPRTDPAVIVLIEHKPKKGDKKCFLAERKTENGWICSTLAGFVEPGESLEQTVKREMMEEAAINVHNIRYVASQPWPFPSSLMIGFMAETNSLDYVLDKREVPMASWFTVKELKDAVKEKGLQLSRKDSIARYLIQTWMNNETT